MRLTTVMQHITHTRTHTHTYTRTHMHTLARTHTHTHAHSHIHTHYHTHIHTHTHTHTHIYKHTHMYTHTPSLTSKSSSRLLVSPIVVLPTLLVVLLTLAPPLVAWTSGVRDLVLTGRAAPDNPAKSGLT